MTAYNSLSTYATITGGYWAFTLTDGAIRMLIVLYFHQLGYSPLAIASLFLFYEFFGIITNLLGGWLGSKIGLNRTMHLGMLLQVMALLMLTVPADYLTVAYVMLAQALSGIAKDLNKMSAKASVKLVIPSQTQQNNPLFKWVAMLTGSKNTLKGIGFFLGGFLLSQFGFQSSLYTLAGGLFLIFIITWLRLPQDLGKTKASLKFTQLFSQSSAINWLSAARFFLFGSRDVWFVVALPIYFSSELGWTHQQTGSFFAFWIIGYGIVQALTPSLLRQQHPTGTTATQLAFFLSIVPLGIGLFLNGSVNPAHILLFGLSIYAVIFAINSAVHSYLIIEWSQQDTVASNVGFYYMANAGGRLAGTVLSGLIFQNYGLEGCLYVASGFVVIAAFLSKKLPSEKAYSET